MTKEENLKRKVNLLKTIPLFSALDTSSLDLLASASDTSTIDPGQTLFKQGDVGREAYILVSGEAEIITEGPEGVITLATIGKNQIAGEIATLIDVPRTATVVAMDELTTLVISKEMFFYLVEKFPRFAIEIMRELARRVSQTTVMVREISSADSGRSAD